MILRGGSRSSQQPFVLTGRGRAERAWPTRVKPYSSGTASSSAAGSQIRPLRTTRAIFRVLRMSLVGLAQGAQRFESVTLVG